ncbi:hypothetical protein H7100_01090 [Candidatus Saccharibacteria bacterium]|nr:hypothetical protein [Candidatus Saccharibacteria bacterium]
MSVTEIDKQLKALNEEYDQLWMSEFEVWEKEFKLDYDDPARADFVEQRRLKNVRIEEIRRERSKLYDLRNEAFKFELKRFTRPSQRFAGLMSRGLGPLPESAKLIHPTEKNLGKVRSFRWLAFGLMLIAISSLVTLTILVPWMRTSPATLLVALFSTWFGSTIGPFVGLAASIGLMFFFPSGITSKFYKGKFLNKAAMFEEQWFRMGAENWTIRQRVYSCAAFGIVHIVNVFYPIASIFVVGMMGGVFMLVYLRFFKKTGSTKLATLASAKLHASYNRFAFLYIFAALGLTTVYVIVSSLMS